MNELMERWQTKWAEAELKIKQLGALRGELIGIESEIRRALHNPDRVFQDHPFHGLAPDRIDVGIKEAFGLVQLEVSLSEQAAKEANNVLAGR